MLIPIRDVKNILTPLDVKFLDKSLSYSCSQTRTCYSPLRILTRKNAMNPSSDIAWDFYEFYKNQIEMNLIDAFICFHPVGMCELYMPFNRSIIIIASTRYELWRFQPKQWNKLNENLKKISQDPKNVIAANNLYDAEYIRYFTGINVTVLPSLCNYTNVDYQPIRKEFLLSLTHEQNFNKIFKEFLNKSLQSYEKLNIKIVPIRQIYHNYKYSDLAKHPAIVYVPYQVSVMSLFEQYRMNIPLVFPSLDLLTRWHEEYGTVNEKTWDQTLYGTLPHGSHIKGVLPDVPDPNDDRNRTSIRYWLNFSDFYQWPHITYYESTDDLVQKLSTTNFDVIIMYECELVNQQLTDYHLYASSIINFLQKYLTQFHKALITYSIVLKHLHTKSTNLLIKTNFNHQLTKHLHDAFLSFIQTFDDEYHQLVQRAKFLKTIHLTIEKLQQQLKSSKLLKQKHKYTYRIIHLNRNKKRQYLHQLFQQTRKHDTFALNWKDNLDNITSQTTNLLSRLSSYSPSKFDVQLMKKSTESLSNKQDNQLTSIIELGSGDQLHSQLIKGNIPLAVKQEQQLLSNSNNALVILKQSKQNVNKNQSIYSTDIDEAMIEKNRLDNDLVDDEDLQWLSIVTQNKIQWQKTNTLSSLTDQSSNDSESIIKRNKNKIEPKDSLHLSNISYTTDYYSQNESD
ncbi:unnamed protein product [Adineta steineri]|uniref:Uncharacterized protein n=2 Tax=Adineta steineri TaxID=433720 RepID=A0A815EU76_9BILA|nr:unnamed protein product [Adineta steineri]